MDRFQNIMHVDVGYKSKPKQGHSQQGRHLRGAGEAVPPPSPLKEKEKRKKERKKEKREKKKKKERKKEGNYE